MAFSSVLGASSVIKPGVCTSTTRPSVPYDGQLIYETDTNLVKAFNGTAFVTVGPAPAAGLTFIAGNTFTAATSVSLPDDTFDGSFRNYRLIFDATTNTSASTITLRYRASGSDNTTANYFQTSVGIDHEGTGVNLAQVTGTSNTVCAGFANHPVSLTLDIIDPNLAVFTRATGFVTFVTSGGAVASREVGLWFNATTVFDSLSLISSVATNMAGAFRVYGYADS